QERHRRDDQHGDQLRSDAPVPEEDRASLLAGGRRGGLHSWSSLPLWREAGWRRIILSQLDRIRPCLGVLSHMLRMRVLSGATLVAIVLSIVGCTSEPPSRQSASVGEVKIGGLAPPRGASRAAATPPQRAAELAAALVNGEAGPTPLLGTSGLTGVGGAALQIVKEDTRGDRDTGVDAAAKLVGQDKVVGLVGAFDTEDTDVASQRAERLRVPFVNGDSSADYLTERGNDWFFRVGPTDRMFGEAFYSALGQIDDNSRRVAALFSNDQRGNVLAGLVEDLASEGGFSMPAGAKVPFNGKDDDPVARVQQVRAAQTDP